MTDRALLQAALHALEKYALNKEPKLVQQIRDQLKKPARDSAVYVLGEGNRVALEKLNSDLKMKRSRRRTVDTVEGV